MTYPDGAASGPHQVLGVLLRTFRIGRFLGVEVRMYWTAAILTPLAFAGMFSRTQLGGALALPLSVLFSALLFTIVWTHEMCHIWMARRHGVPTWLITLSPLGGLAHLGHPVPTPASDIQVALAGPAVHLAWLAVVWPLHWLAGDALLQSGGTLAAIADWVLWFLVSSNLSMLAFNLLPIFPLDGGRALRGLLALRWHPNRVTMWVTAGGIVGGALIIVSGLGALDDFVARPVAGTLTLLIGLSCILACLNERRVARHARIYEGVQRHPWEGDPDAWRRGGSIATAVQPRAPGLFTRWRARRQQQQAERDRALDAEVDEILGRLHQVGMQGLSARDKAVLKRASNRRRGAG